MRPSSIVGEGASDLPPAVAALSRLLPSRDREWIVGDLLEDAQDRGVSGARLMLWLCAHCASIALGLTADRARGAFTVPPLREMASGVALDGSQALRAAWAPRAVLLRFAIFCASVATLAIVAEVLVGALFSAAGLRSR